MADRDALAAQAGARPRTPARPSYGLLAPVFALAAQAGACQGVRDATITRYADRLGPLVLVPAWLAVCAPLALLTLLTVVVGCGPREPAAVTLSGRTMGTSFRVILAADVGDEAIRALELEVRACLDDVEARMSTYRSDSDLSRWNVSRAGDWFPVDASVIEVAVAARDIHERSGGAFDATVFPLVDLWGFGPRRERRVPAAADLEAARALVGGSRVESRRDPPALRKDADGLSLDFSAIAKGYAVDRVASVLESLGHARWFVEVGGEVRVRGERPNGGPWRIGIEEPVASQERQVHAVLELREGAVATSGDYRNAFIEDGKHYSHTIDPRTGWPIDHDTVSVSVVAPDCMSADGWATALLVLGRATGYDLAVREGLAVLFLHRGPDGTLLETATPRFPPRQGSLPAR